MAQETSPALSASFIQLPIAQFWVDVTNDSLWHYRGVSLGWIRIARFSELSSGGSGGSGVNGKTILNGTVAPDTLLGTEGDFYLNTTTKIFYGPKTNSAWGSGFSIVGATGLTGPTGPSGSGNVKTGSVTLNGSGQVMVTIAHGSATPPTFVAASAGSFDAIGDFFTTWDNTNIYINYSLGIVPGSNNVIINWILNF